MTQLINGNQGVNHDSFATDDAQPRSFQAVTSTLWATVWKAILREELLWLLHTLGIISLSLAIGRLITYLTKGGDIDLSLLHGDWQRQVDAALKQREEQIRHRTTDEKEHDS